MSFHNVNLPKYIEIFAVGSSEFSTALAVSMSGREVRNSNTRIPRRRYVLKDCRLSTSQFETFNSFFKARAGMRFAFRLKDHFDYKAEKQIIAVGDGVNVEFQLQKLYEDLISPHIRLITKPVLETIKLWNDNTDVEAESIDSDTGKGKLSYPLLEGQKLYASFEFDVPVRFVDDSFQYSFNKDATITIDNVELIEVHE